MLTDLYLAEDQLIASPLLGLGKGREAPQLPVAPHPSLQVCEPDTACVHRGALQLVLVYLATNKKKEVSNGAELPILPGPPACWQFTQTAFTSPPRSAVLHQASSEPVVRVSA
jgi:hypothetical protein